MNTAGKILGIDYGSKLAGTTAVAWFGDGVHFAQSVKGKDADVFLRSFIDDFTPEAVFIDAPLSLPFAYFSETHDDYFFRKCDRDVQAMSPMFLGGLTARAIQLTRSLEAAKIKCYESYPRGLVNELSLSNPDILTYYKKDPVTFVKLIVRYFDLKIKEPPQNHHQVDALLALLVGKRVLNREHKTFGAPDEGLIYI